jgi:hypothetical protein
VAFVPRSLRIEFHVATSAMDSCGSAHRPNVYGDISFLIIRSMTTSANPSSRAPRTHRDAKGEIDHAVEVFRSSTTHSSASAGLIINRADISNCRGLRWQFGRGKSKRCAERTHRKNGGVFSLRVPRRALRWIVVHQSAASLAYLG